VEVQEATLMPEGNLVPLLDEKGNVILDEKGNPVLVPGGNLGGGTGDGSVSPMPEQNLNFFQKVWNAIKSFFGVNPSNNTPQLETPSGPVPGILPKGL
jgi:hypothetical protein